MGQNWDNFLKNLGEWHGSFTKVSAEGVLLGSTPSILNLTGLEDNQLVIFRLRRFGEDSDSPTSDYSQEYRSLGKQGLFFDTGAFSKGALQYGPFSEFGAEYGFVGVDRRLRLVQLFDKQGCFSEVVLIREFRTGSDGQERPALDMHQLVGKWEGKACNAYPNWSHSQIMDTTLEIKDLGNGKFYQQFASSSGQSFANTAQLMGNQLTFVDSATPQRMLLLPDGTSSHVPLEIKVRQAFFVESGWLVSPTRRERLIRYYDHKGEWISATHFIEHKVS
ncbi:MAG: DUF3598 family protein [Pseudanabaena sp. ELA607]|jgi:hypothetical protein